MGKLVTIGVRIPKEILRDLEESAKEENVDKFTVIRRFILEGLREYKRERAARLYKERRVAIAGAAELAGLTVIVMVDYLIRKRYKSSYSYEDLEKEMELIRKGSAIG
jgi:predicted HTH domain antitoxin